MIQVPLITGTGSPGSFCSLRKTSVKRAETDHCQLPRFRKCSFRNRGKSKTRPVIDLGPPPHRAYEEEEQEFGRAWFNSLCFCSVANTRDGPLRQAFCYALVSVTTPPWQNDMRVCTALPILLDHAPLPVCTRNKIGCHPDKARTGLARSRLVEPEWCLPLARLVLPRFHTTHQRKMFSRLDDSIFYLFFWAGVRVDKSALINACSQKWGALLTASEVSRLEALDKRMDEAMGQRVGMSQQAEQRKCDVAPNH